MEPIDAQAAIARILETIANGELTLPSVLASDLIILLKWLQRKAEADSEFWA